MGGEEGLHVAHIGVLREQALHQRVVGRHVGQPQHQHQIRPGRDAVALLHRGLGHRAGLEGGHVLGALAVERDLGNHAQAAHLGRRHDGHLALDDAGLHQAPHPAQRGGR